jgi:hypothetical protein
MVWVAIFFLVCSPLLVVWALIELAEWRARH